MSDLREVKIGSDVQADWLQNDPMIASYIRNRPFYEGKKKVFSPLNLTWDGNTEGLVCVMGIAYKVSDDVFTDEQTMKTSVTLSNGQIYSVSDMYALGLIESTEDAVISDTVLIIRKSGFVLDPDDPSGGSRFDEYGVYIIKKNDDPYVIAITSTDPIEHTEKTIIHKIDSKFLPDDAGNKIPYFDFKALGMQDVTGFNQVIPLGMTDTEEKKAAIVALNSAMEKGFIRIAFGFNGMLYKMNLACLRIGENLAIGAGTFPNPDVLGSSFKINPVTVCLSVLSDGLYFIIRNEFVGSTAAITSITLKKDATGAIIGGTAHRDNGGTADITVEAQ